MSHFLTRWTAAAVTPFTLGGYLHAEILIGFAMINVGVI
jgi:hypothetical protein